MSAGMKEGQPIKIYYDPSNPNRISSTGSIFPILLVPLIGMPFFLIGFIPLYKQRKRRKLKEALLTIGHRVLADVHRVIKRRSRKHGPIVYYVICIWTERNGTVHFFKSDRLWEYPRLEGITKIIVYLDPNDYSRNYVDMNMIQGTPFSPAAGSTQNTIPELKDRRERAPFNAKNAYLEERTVYVISPIILLAGIGIIYRHLTSPVTEIPLFFFGSIFTGMGILLNARLFYLMLSPQKTIPALLVSINETGVIIGAKLQYSLIFQNEKGKYYYFFTYDVSNIEENSTYIVMVKANKALNVGAQHFQQIYPRKT